MARAPELRAIALLLGAPATPVIRTDKPGLFSVASARGGPKRYTVDLGRDPPSCTCPRYQWVARLGEEPRPTCKHIEAVRLAIRAREGLGVPLS
jgi:SWIM zinc finger